MEALKAIGVKVELVSGNVAPLLHEIRHALDLLLATGHGTSIDLKSIPLAPGEEERILEALGTGEVRAELSVFGSSELVETRYPGVWVITHFDAQGATQARLIEVARVPEILCAQPTDIADGLGRLCTRLNVSGGHNV